MSKDAPPAAGTYSQAVEAGGFVFLAGQTPRDTNNKRHGDLPFPDQARMALDNLEAVAKAAGLSLRNAVKVNVYLKDPEDAKAFDEVYKNYVGTPPPARALTISPFKDFALEVDAILFRQE